MKITVEVTAEDIKNGEPHNCRKCPIALAVRRALPGEYVEVSRQRVLVGVGGTKIQIPPVAREFINRFDNGLWPVPFTFELDDTGASSMTCDSKLNLSGNCNRCRTPAELHFVENITGSLNPELLCANCCPVCKPSPEKQWSGLPETVSGEQAGFSF